MLLSSSSSSSSAAARDGRPSSALPGSDASAPLAHKDKRKSKGDDAHSYDDADMTRPQLLNDNIHELMIPTPPYAAESAPDGRNSGQGKDKTTAKPDQHHHKDAQSFDPYDQIVTDLAVQHQVEILLTLSARLRGGGVRRVPSAHRTITGQVCFRLRLVVHMYRGVRV